MCLLVLCGRKEKTRLVGLPFFLPPQTDQISIKGWFGFFIQNSEEKKGKKPRSTSCIVDSVWIVIGTVNTKKLTVMCLIIIDKLENMLA